MNAAAALLGLVVAGLAAIVVLELRPRPEPAVDAAGEAARAALVVPAAGSNGAAVVATRVATLLARPLFSQTRRPPDRPDAPSGAAAPDGPLPRMTGILIDGHRRSALFVAPGGGKPISVTVGGKIGPFTVEDIEPQQVVVLGPEGRRIVRTSFDPNPPAPVAPLAAPPLIAPQFPGIAVPPGAGVPQFPPGPRGIGYGAAR